MPIKFPNRIFWAWVQLSTIPYQKPFNVRKRWHNRRESLKWMKNIETDEEKRTWTLRTNLLDLHWLCDHNIFPFVCTNILHQCECVMTQKKKRKRKLQHWLCWKSYLHRWVSFSVTKGAVTHTGRQGALERGEAAGERCLQLRGEEDSQLCDDASCDQLVRGHIKGWVPHLNTCRERRQRCQTASQKTGSKTQFLHFHQNK